MQKQIVAIQGDTSEEGSMRSQKLVQQLNEQRQSLEDKEREQFLQDQEEMLDSLYNEYESLITSEMEDIEGLLKKGITIVESMASDIGVTIGDYLSKYNYDGKYDGIDEGLEDMKTNDSDNSTPPTPEPTQNNSNDRIYGMGLRQIEQKELGDLGSATQISSTRQVTAPKEVEVKTLTVAAESTSSSTKKTTDTKKTTSGGDGKITVGEKVKFDSGKYTASSDGSGNSGKQNLGKDVYVQKINSGSKRPYLIGTGKSSGVLGWVAKKQLAGFKTGGIARFIRSKGEDGLAMVRNGEGLIAPENVSDIQQLIKTVPQVNDMLQPLVTMPKLPDVKPLNNGVTYVANYDNITLPSVTNFEEFKSGMYQDMQENANFEKMVQTMATPNVNGSRNRLSKNSIKF